jgi:hypothetical protein
MGGMNMGGSGAEQSSLTLKDMVGLMLGTKPMDPNGYGFIRRLSSGICKNCTVLAGRTSVTFENGTEAGVANGVYIHHAFTMDVTKPVPTFITNCGDVAGAISPFLGAGVDDFTQYYTTPDGKFPSGFYIKDDTFIMQAEIVNYKSVPQKIFIDMDIEYVPGRVGSDATQAFISATS